VPIIVGAEIVVPPVDPPPPPPPPIDPSPPPAPPVEPVGPALIFTDVDGVDWLLTDINGGYRALAGWRGLDSPEYQHYLDESPALNGSFWRGSRKLHRVVYGPILIEGPDRATAIARRRAFIEAADPQRGLGTLTVVESDGTSRHIPAFKASGLEGDTSEDMDGIVWAKGGVTFFGPEPDFLGDDQVATVRPAASVPFYPIYPLRMAANRTFGDLSLPNPGSAYAWPVWRIEGPCTAIDLTNDTTGLTLSLVITLSNVQWVEIDTREGHKTIRDQSGAPRWNTVQDGSALWPLVRGDNAVDVSLTGSTSDSLLTVTYAARYLTA
jgi:hypothetical protein